MAVSCFCNALLHWRVLYLDSCFLSCLAPRSAFTVLHHLKSHVIVVNVGAQSDMWTLILLQGQLEGPGMHDSDPATLYDPFPRVPIYRGRSHWTGQCHGQAYCWSFPMTQSPKTSFMEATSGRCHGSLVSSLAYSGRAPAGQEAVLFDQRYVWVREDGCELVSSFPVATPGVSMLPHCMKCVRGYSGMNCIDPRDLHAPSPLLLCSHVPLCSKFLNL